MSQTKKMTVGNPTKLLLQFALPVFIGNIFQQLYNMVDSIIVGKFVGPDALAAVGVTGSTTFFIFSLVLGLTTGISVMIAQFFGAQDEESLRLSFSTSIYVVTLSSIILAALGFFVTRPVLILLQTPANILEDAVLYMHIIMVGSIALVLYYWIASVLRALGDSVTPLIFLIISSILNVLLDLQFVVVFHLGVAGVGYATILSQFLSGVACLIYAMIRMPILRLRIKDLKFDKKMCMNVVRIGIPSGIQGSFIAISVMAMQAVINSYGSIVVAGFIAATKIESIIFQSGNSIGMANATFTGQNMGAGDIGRVKAGYRSMVFLNIISYLVILPFLWFFAGDLMKLFVNHSDEAKQVIDVGTRYLHIVTPFFIPVGLLMGFQNLLRSAGYVSATMILGLSEVFSRVIFAFSLSYYFGFSGAFAATPTAWIVGCALGFYYYYSGKWVTKGIVQKSNNDSDVIK